ncbi:hypothetical protein AYK25_07570 [Thermoplasmatales archaeon SM1-50]|nr:MAG: hypothetical protein AYK25_07570 [Thermoplasmatales archaeon SM1-50]
MTNNCLVCGSELREDAKFCPVCGRKLEQQTVSPTPPPPTPVSSQPQQKKQKPKVSTTPATTQPVTKQNHGIKYGTGKKAIVGISLTVVAVVIVIFFVANLLGGTSPFVSADSRFVGEWEENTLGNPIIWNFKSDSTLENPSSDGEMNNVGTWNVDVTSLCLFYRQYNQTVCYTYQFSNNGNILTLERTAVGDSYPANILLTKKGQPGSAQTPYIQCNVDSDTNRIIITQIDENVKWKDILVITNPAATWQIQDANNQALAKIGIIATITTYVGAGDNILLLAPSGAITVSLTYLPTSASLGEWTINV